MDHAFANTWPFVCVFVDAFTLDACMWGSALAVRRSISFWMRVVYESEFFHDMLGSIADRGRALLERSGTRAATTNQSGRTAVRGQSQAGIEDLCRALLTGRGEASGVALARQILDLYASLPAKARVEFFHILARDFGPDQDRLRAAWVGYEQAPSPVSLQVLLRAVEPPRQELFRRLNLAPGGTRALVMIRET